MIGLLNRGRAAPRATLWRSMIVAAGVLVAPAAGAGSRCADLDFTQSDAGIRDCTSIIDRGHATWLEYFARGSYHQFKHNADLALADFNTCIRLFPKDDDSCRSERGSIYLNLGKFDEAIVDFRKVVSQPVPTMDNYGHLIDAYKGRAAAYEKGRQFQKAADDYGMALKITADAFHRKDSALEAAKGRALRSLQESGK